MNYQNFLEAKIRIAPKTGFDIHPEDLNPILKPHQRDIVQWSIKGGTRAVFASFGLGKTIMQLETNRLIQTYKGGNVLFVCPLGVKQEFQKDAKKLGMPKLKYITNTSGIQEGQNYYITNYERIRKGDIDASQFISVTFDEASVLRNLETDTTNAILDTFGQIQYRFVHTATPAPNDYLELINYAAYLGIMDRGQALTRFFQRDSTKAGNLTLYPNRKKEFWFWMSSWAVFITKPSDLGYDDTGYELPPLVIHRHMVTFDRSQKVDKITGQSTFIPDSSSSLPEAAKEKRLSMPYRIAKMKEIIDQDPDDHFITWHHLEDERKEIQKVLGSNCRSVYGSQSIDEKENAVEEFSEGGYKYLSSKPSILGSGCNFQYHCHKAIFVGINYEFNDFIQAVFRVYRFMQAHECHLHLIFTDAELEILKTLEEKWNEHNTLQSEMTDIIKEFGLNSDLYQYQLKREMFTGRQEKCGENWVLVNNDSVDEYSRKPDCSIGLFVSSIPFGNHYEFSENFNCFGHNVTNEEFFEQMDFLVPNMYRTLKPGRIAAIHVKDRIRYSYMNGTGFTSIDPFSDDTVRCFRKHGFHLLSRITITTDVVSENNQTYRLGWSEACKDMTKMGAGLPEYVLIFRKPPTENYNAYGDEPVVHEKSQYSLARWQLDAHAFWKSSGERLIDTEYLKKLDLSDVLKAWKALDTSEIYDFNRHVAICEALTEVKMLSKKFMCVPPQSNNDHVWDDISRVNTLNSDQARRNLTKHICPMQLDVIERCIERFSNPGDVVADPFNGIGSVVYQAVKMGRHGDGCELNTEYWQDSIKHVRSADLKQAALTLF
jgi:DNA modification methylase